MNFYLPLLMPAHSVSSHRISYHQLDQLAILQDLLKKQAAEFLCVGIPVYVPVHYSICFIYAGTVPFKFLSALQKTSIKTLLTPGV